MRAIFQYTRGWLIPSLQKNVLNFFKSFPSFLLIKVAIIKKLYLIIYPHSPVVNENLKIACNFYINRQNFAKNVVKNAQTRTDCIQSHWLPFTPLEEANRAKAKNENSPGHPIQKSSKVRPKHFQSKTAARQSKSKSSAKQLESSSKTARKQLESSYHLKFPKCKHLLS